MKAVNDPSHPTAAPGDVLTVVGIGADGWAGLPARARQVISAADVLVGGERHLAMVPRDDVPKVSWPKPFRDGLPALFAQYRNRRVVVVASGDPMVSGVGRTLVELFGAAAVRIVPAVSSVALARARLGWPADSVAVVSVVGRNVSRVARELSPGRRILVLSSDAHTPAAVADLLVDRGYGPSRLTVLENLDADDERLVDGLAADWSHPPGAPLNIIGIECAAAEGAAVLATVPGLPDDAFEHDGQLTKRDIRATCLARLVPLPGQLLWDVGAGSGSIAIEWMRTHPENRAVAIEADPDRAARITRNAQRLGVPDLCVITGTAPDVLAEAGAAAGTPDAVFLGGGVSAPGLIETCLTWLSPGGRLVAHGVTVETEIALAGVYRERGGELLRLAVERAGPLGGFTGWQPARSVTQWSITKENR